MELCSCEPFQTCQKCAKSIKKPGVKAKKAQMTSRTIRNIIEPPEGHYCRRCDDETGTESYRHLETFRKYQIGKGTGTKCHNRFTAWLCSDCDNIVSNMRQDKNNEVEVFKHAEEWNWLIMKTWLL